jgi:hypothetical protein
MSRTEIVLISLAIIIAVTVLAVAVWQPPLFLNILRAPTARSPANLTLLAGTIALSID